MSGFWFIGICKKKKLLFKLNMFDMIYFVKLVMLCFMISLIKEIKLF